MPTPTKGPRLGGGPAHERLILANLATSLFEHDKITTTAAKAKRLRPLAERLITFAKRGDLHARRRVLTVVRDKGVVHRLFAEIAPDMAAREGGYTRITKIGARKGDNAPMAVIELVREPLSAKKATVKEAEAATKRAAKQSESKQAAAETEGRRGRRDEAPRPPRSLPSRAARGRRRGERGRLGPRGATPSRATPTPACTTRPTASGTTRRSPSSGSSPPRTPRPPASRRPAPVPEPPDPTQSDLVAPARAALRTVVRGALDHHRWATSTTRRRPRRRRSARRTRIGSRARTPSP